MPMLTKGRWGLQPFRPVPWPHFHSREDREREKTLGLITRSIVPRSAGLEAGPKQAKQNILTDVKALALHLHTSAPITFEASREGTIHGSSFSPPTPVHRSRGSWSQTMQHKKRNKMDISIDMDRTGPAHGDFRSFSQVRPCFPLPADTAVGHLY